MKKFATLVLAAGLVVSSFAGASAGEFKPNAQFINQFEASNAGSLFEKNGMGVNEHFKASMRMRLGFDYIASETLSGTFLMQLGEYDYGNSNVGNGNISVGSSFDAYQTNIRVRLAYVDWIIPTTAVQVRMGFQPIALPAFAFGSAVLDTRGTGVTVAASIDDNIAFSLNWTRAESNDSRSVSSRGDDADIFVLATDFDYDGFRFAPWAMYAIYGRNASKGYYVAGTNPNAYNSSAWYIGTSFEFATFDPFVFALDAYYSATNVDTPTSMDGDSMHGYFVGASASYKTDWGTPALKGWYSSGADTAGTSFSNTGRPATIIGAFAATSIMFDDQVMDNGMSNYTSGNPAGTMGLVLEWANLSCFEKLDHTVRVAYIAGTNDYGTALRTINNRTALTNLSTEDSVIEFNLNSTYEIYKNLSTTLELGYLTADYNSKFNANQDDAIMRSALSFTYSF